jgi:hypothetical protein
MLTQPEVLQSSMSAGMDPGEKERLPLTDNVNVESIEDENLLDLPENDSAENLVEYLKEDDFEEDLEDDVDDADSDL